MFKQSPRTWIYFPSWIPIANRKHNRTGLPTKTNGNILALIMSYFPIDWLSENTLVK